MEGVEVMVVEEGYVGREGGERDVSLAWLVIESPYIKWVVV